jgi:hypothetical protein
MARRRLLNAGPPVVAGVFSNRGSQNRGVIMIKTSVRTAAATALLGMAALSLSTTANAGDGKAVGAGLLGFGVGAIVGSAIAPREVYVAPPAPPPPPAYYGPAAYGPPAWSPAWYQYCRSRYGPGFDPQSGYFQGPDGAWYFCR